MMLWNTKTLCLSHLESLKLSPSCIGAEQHETIQPRSNTGERERQEGGEGKDKKKDTLHAISC